MLPGLDNAPAYMPYSGLTTTVSVALVPADSASLVPAALVEKADGGLPKAETARVVGLQARAYRGVLTGDSVLDIYAIPTTRGVLDPGVHGAQRLRGLADLVPEGLDQITVEGARPITLNDAHRVPHARAGDDEGPRRGARARAGGAAPRQGPGRPEARRD